MDRGGLNKWFSSWLGFMCHRNSMRNYRLPARQNTPNFCSSRSSETNVLHLARHPCRYNTSNLDTLLIADEQVRSVWTGWFMRLKRLGHLWCRPSPNRPTLMTKDAKVLCFGPQNNQAVIISVQRGLPIKPTLLVAMSKFESIQSWYTLDCLTVNCMGV